MKLFLEKLAKRNRYFIGADIGPQDWSHMTIKFLGELSPEQVDKVKAQMSVVAQNTSKTEVRSLGLGLLGRKKPNLVDFIENTDNVKNLFKHLNNKSPVPHITRMYGKPGKYGPYEPVKEELIEEIHLYRSDGFQDFKKVYTVKLQRRSPLQWIKDQFNF